MRRSVTLAGLFGCVALSAVAAKAPNITSISPISPAETQNINIRGRGFGKLAPYDGDSDYIEWNICRGHGCALSFRYGYTPNGNVTGLVIKSWTDTRIDIGGFTNYHAQGSIPLQDGDRIKIDLYKPVTGQHKHVSQFEITVHSGPSTCAKR